MITHVIGSEIESSGKKARRGWGRQTHPSLEQSFPLTDAEKQKELNRLRNMRTDNLSIDIRGIVTPRAGISPLLEKQKQSDFDDRGEVARENFPNKLAYDGAFSAGRNAKLNGGECPFDGKQVYFQIWRQGFKSVSAGI